MNKLASVLRETFNVELSNEFVRKAAYYSRMDFLEYVSEDSFTISDRIDSYLTVLWDKNQENMIGFRLKGFGYLFNNIIKKEYKLNDEDFNPIIRALEILLTDIGDQLISKDDTAPKDERTRAYKSTMNLIRNHDVRLPEDFKLEAA